MPDGVRVLVVDDDDDVREIIAEILEEEGYTVTTAGNGAEALDVLRRMPHDLILLDLTMPVMSAEEFRVQQLADPTLEKIPTVVMTAADRVAEKTASMKVAAILTKPVKIRMLVETVARFCRP